MLFYRPWSVPSSKSLPSLLNALGLQPRSVHSIETLGKVFLEADHPVNISINLDIPVTI